jgi:hypothetical protein
VASQLYNVTISRKNREIEKVSVHLDVEGDQDVLNSVLRQLVLDAVDRAGWAKKSAHEFTLTARRPGWARDAFKPYTIPRSEIS